MPDPLDWLHRTFTSRSTTEQLLKPELENGLTPHDFELAQKFLPGPSQYWPIGYGFFTGSLAAAYGRLYRRPPWSIQRASLIAGLAGFTGVMYGQFKRVQAHWVFIHALENPSTFMQALENVNRRTGGVKPLGFSLGNAQRQREDNGEEPKDVQPLQDDGWGNPESPDVSRSSKGTPPSPPSPAPSRRWEQIRAENARSVAQNSSWDALRQKHERERVQNASRHRENDHEGNYVDDDRVSDQARQDKEGRS